MRVSYAAISKFAASRELLVVCMSSVYYTLCETLPTTRRSQPPTPVHDAHTSHLFAVPAPAKKDIPPKKEAPVKKATPALAKKETSPKKADPAPAKKEISPKRIDLPPAAQEDPPQKAMLRLPGRPPIDLNAEYIAVWGAEHFKCICCDVQIYGSEYVQVSHFHKSA